MIESSNEGPDRMLTSEVVVAVPLALAVAPLELPLLPPLALTSELCPILNVAPTWK